MEKITGSVGRGGDNQTIDVSLIQKLLNSNHIPGETTPLEVDGIISEAFQKNILFMTLPDGRVDPDGKTFNKLIAASTETNQADINALSVKAIDLLKSIEELATTPYDDQTGKDITHWVEGATIGYGHLIAKDEWSKYQNGITKQQALDLFENDLTPYIVST